MSLIEIQNITKIYKQAKLQHYALREISLNINSGKMIVFSGPSGSGKTTLLNIIGSLDSPTEGNIIINGNNITTMTSSQLADFRLHNLGFIFQSYNLFNVLNAIENVSLPLQLKGLSKRKALSLAAEALSDVGLQDFAKRKPNELSGGQQQRVAVARALVGKPTLILGDEPTANLDSANSLALIQLMKNMKDKYNTTIILSSHDFSVINTAEINIKLKDGSILQ